MLPTKSAFTVVLPWVSGVAEKKKTLCKSRLQTLWWICSSLSHYYFFFCCSEAFSFLALCFLLSVYPIPEKDLFFFLFLEMSGSKCLKVLGIDQWGFKIATPNASNTRHGQILRGFRVATVDCLWYKIFCLLYWNVRRCWKAAIACSQKSRWWIYSRSSPRHKHQNNKHSHLRMWKLHFSFLFLFKEIS